MANKSWKRIVVPMLLAGLTAAALTGCPEWNLKSPIASFTANLTMGEAPLTVQFTDTSTSPFGPITARLWLFGDGDSSADPNPTHTYAEPGMYNVSLTVSNEFGDDTALQLSYIMVTDGSEGEGEGEGEGEMMTDTIMLPGNVPMELVWIPDGSFAMGAPDTESVAYQDERPRHAVSFSYGYWMCRYEVTKAQWKAVMDTEPWNAPGLYNVLPDPDSPAVYITWTDANAFATAVSDLTGMNFRLPSESEWEYACRAGTETPRYWGTDDSNATVGAHAWWRTNADIAGEPYAHVVGQKQPNAWGLYDMLGNVFEWCEDRPSDYQANAPVNGDPWLFPPNGESRILRGGSWQSRVERLRCAARFNIDDNTASGEIGFRLAAGDRGGEGEGEGGDACTNFTIIPEEKTYMLPGNVPLVMVHVPGGCFERGAYDAEQDSEADEYPQHEVSLSRNHWMSKYEITKRQWVSLMGTFPWFGQPGTNDDLDSPAEFVSYDDTAAFIRALGVATDLTLGFRLPRDVEWENACRAGTESRFHWGDDPTYSVGNDYAWWANNTAGEAYTHVVGQKLPNAWNLYDMNGNAAEWVRDHYGVYPVGPLTDPNGPQNSQGYVIRGGDYSSVGADCRSAARDMAPGDTKRAGLGFRVVHP